MRGKYLAIATLAAALGAGVAHAQAVDVGAQIKLIETQPADMDRSAWKEKRREAARKLITSKDKRAVPVLIKLADTETFDIIGEIAIEGLGNLGDPAGVPVLQKVANDQTRDKATRDLAKKALGKLGATATSGGPTGGGKPDGGKPDGGKPDGGKPDGGKPDGGKLTGGKPDGGKPDGGKPDGGKPDGGKPDGGGTGGGTEGGSEGGAEGGTEGGPLSGGAPGDVGPGGSTGSHLLDTGGDKKAVAVPAGPILGEDVLAAYDRLTFALGTASLAYDTVRKRPSFNGDLAGHYAKRIEREQMAWGWNADAHVVASFVNPKTNEQERGAQVDAVVGGEARFYRGKIYGIGKAVGGLQDNYISATPEDPAQMPIKDNRLEADVQVAIGGGYGRVLDVGGAIRVRRLARTLDAARALGKAIDPATAKKLQLTWWALRGERSAYRALTATVAILREAGILLGEPDAGLSYELLEVLRDTQLYVRPSGLDVQVAFGEGYLIRPDMNPTPIESGRVEMLVASAGYGQQFADDKAELSGTGFARMRLFAPDEQYSPWALGGTARLRRFAYGEHGDPLGALDLTATLLLSKDTCPVNNAMCINPGNGMRREAKAAARIEAELGYTMFMNQVSGLRLAANVAQDGGQIFIGANLTATYGLLDGTFAGL